MEMIAREEQGEDARPSSVPTRSRSREEQNYNETTVASTLAVSRQRLLWLPYRTGMSVIDVASLVRGHARPVQALFTIDLDQGVTASVPVLY